MAAPGVGHGLGCPHIATSASHISHANLDIIKECSQCSVCDEARPEIWLCLYRDCLARVCTTGKSNVDDRHVHYNKNQSHCVFVSLSTLHVWCYACDGEVVLPPAAASPATVDVHYQSQPVANGAAGGVCRLRQADSAENDGDSDDSRSTIMDDNNKPKGLTGLQNIGNTCYMNAALQALSNTPPLTEFFLGCGVSVLSNADSAKKPLTLSKSYHRLMQELWDRKRRGYVAPTGILYGIRNAHPMFRGYHQHDTQEFLRCFMDLLHEELKVPLVDPPFTQPQPSYERRMSGMDDQELSDGEADAETSSVQAMAQGGGGEGEGGGASSQSEGEEYETCDSGVSERSSLSEETSSAGMKNNRSLSRSPSPPPERLRSKLTNCSTKQQHHGSPRSSHRSRKAQVKYRSIISDVFDGKLLSSVQCLTCNRISTRVEAFQDLSLPIPSRDHLNMLHQGSVNSTLAKCTELYATDQGWFYWLWEWLCSWFWGPTVSLHDCLSAFFSADELKGDNMYSCEKCNKLRNGVKFSKVLELPEVLCIHLKRFRHELMFSSKISSHVTFPLDGLELRPYLHKDCVSQVTQYDLVSVICHHGAAGSGGHYTCYSLNAQSDQWYEFDDQCVTRVSPDVVRNCEAYVLFYRKNGSNVHHLRTKASHLIHLTADDPGPRYAVSKQWVNRFNTFAEPGPIDNTDFLCAHNQLIPGRETNLHHLTTALPAPVWDYLFEKFGGGPVCTLDKLSLCNICNNNNIADSQGSGATTRQEAEMKEFSRLDQDLQMSTVAGQLNAVSLKWFVQWNSFVKGWSPDPPGPIDNSHLTINKGKQVAQGVDYRQVSKEQWDFFQRTYGGGPEVVIRLQNNQPAVGSNSCSKSPPPPRDYSSENEVIGDSVSSGHWSNGSGSLMDTSQIGDCSNFTPELMDTHSLTSSGDHTIATDCTLQQQQVALGNSSAVLGDSEVASATAATANQECLLSLLDVRIDTSTPVEGNTAQMSPATASSDNIKHAGNATEIC